MSSGIRPRAGAASALLAAVERLELVARHNAAGLQSGDYPTAIRGQGLVFLESRKYVPGEPARRIDWNVTARLGEPYVKVHLEERQRDVLLALDVSPSMHSGFQERTKIEYAVELAATLAVSAVEGGDRVGLVAFADRVIAEERPRGGRRQLFRVLRALVEHAAPWRRPVAESDPRAALAAVGRQRKQRFVVFLISDFIDHDIPDDLKYVRAQNDVSLLHVYDPVEYEAAGDVVLHAFSPERHERRRSLRPGAGGTLAEMEAFLRHTASRHRVDAVSFSTAEAVAPALARFFHAKRRRLAR